MSELGPESNELLALEREFGEPTASELESRRLAVFASLGIALPVDAPPDVEDAPPTSDTSSAVPGAGATPSAGLATKLTIVAGLAIAVTSAYLATRSPSPVRPSPANDRPPATSAAVESASPNVEAPQVPIETVEPARAPSITPPRTPIVRETPPERVAEPVVPIENHEPDPAPPASDSLSEESMLVAAAEAQLRAGHASEALSLYDRALARHASGALRVEALAGRIASLCRLGRTDEGRRELERFLASYPRSPSAQRLRTSCGVEP